MQLNIVLVLAGASLASTLPLDAVPRQAETAAPKTTKLNWYYKEMGAPCEVEGYYCWKNGVDLATCDSQAHLITNRNGFVVVNENTPCTPGEYIGTLDSIDALKKRGVNLQVMPRAADAEAEPELEVFSRAEAVVTTLPYIQSEFACSTKHVGDLYCWLNGQDLAMCNPEVGYVTNVNLLVAKKACTPGEFMGAL